MKFLNKTRTMKTSSRILKLCKCALSITGLFVVFSSSLSPLWGCSQWTGATNSSPPSFVLTFIHPLSLLCSSPSLLSVYTVIAPQSSPSISIRDSTSSLPFSAQGYLQTDSCYIYWGMKLPLHPLRAPKRCSTVEKCNTNIGTKEGVEHAGGDEHNANHRFIKASKRGEVMLALISPRASEILSKKLIWNWLDDGGGWWQAVQL